MGGPAVVVVILAVLVYAGLAITALRRPLLARVAAREAIRRPVQSLVVIAGLTIGTGAILGPQVWYDSITDSFIAAANRSWGRVDITVSAGGTSFGPDVAERLAADPALRTSVAGVQAGVDLVGSVSDLDQRLGLSAVRIVGFDPAAQAPFGAYVLDDGTQTYGDGLGSDNAILSRSLADSIQARPGDTVRVAAGSRTIELNVAGIAKPEGPGNYGLRPAVFLALPAAPGLVGSDLINVVWITATGDGQAESEAARMAAPLVGAVLAGAPGGPALDVREVKADEAAAQARYQEDTGWVFLFFSLLVVAVGTALVVNLMVALAEERRPRLAVLRTLGLSRSGLVRLSLLEGAVYSLVASPLSLVTGGLITWVLFAYAADATVQGVDGRDIVMRPSVRTGTVVACLALGALVTLVTVFATAVRTSRMTIASAIKDLPEPEPAPRLSWLRLAGLLGLAVVGIVALLAGDVRVAFVGAWALIAVASALVRGHVPDRARATVVGALLTAWSVAMLLVYGPSSLNLDVAIQVYFLGVATSVFGLSLLVAANLRVLEELAARLGGVSTLRATLRPPLAYMTRRPLRTGLTFGVLGMVVASITVWTVSSAAVNSLDVDRDSGGFDVEVTSARADLVTLPADVRIHVARSISIPTRHYLGRERTSFGSGAVAMDWHDELIPLYELSGAAVGSALPRLSQRDASFSSDADVWKAVASDPTWIISSWWGGHGGKIWLIGRNGPVELKIAGSFASGLLDGIAGSREALAPFVGFPAGTTLLVQAQDGTDAADLALQVRRSLFAEGVEAFTTRALLDQGAVQPRTWGTIFQLFSVMGLVAGVLSLGVLALRAVLERRRAIGILRALGSQPRSVLAGILIEATLIVAVGVAVGLVAGLEATSVMLNVDARVTPVRDVDVAGMATSLAMIYGALLVVALLASVGPAVRASRLSPVEAMRPVD